MDKLYVIKTGGSIIDDENRLNAFLRLFAAIDGLKILVHGGGKLATQLADKLGMPQEMVEGRRITDANTLKLVTMVFAGYINKNIVVALQSMHTNAIGLSGADANLILARKREAGNIDYGFAGDVTNVNTAAIRSFLEKGMTPVIAPITHNGEGQLLNTNADTIARELAVAMSAGYETSLVYCFEKQGVLSDVTDERSVIPAINTATYQELKTGGVVAAGMIPKLDNAFAALQRGVRKVVIGQSEDLPLLITGESGTTITNE